MILVPPELVSVQTAMSLMLPASGSNEELEALYAGLPRVPCECCGSEAVPLGSCCPRSIPCPVCHATEGARCRRPSGHPAADLHAPRIKAAEAIDRSILGGTPRV